MIETQSHNIYAKRDALKQQLSVLTQKENREFHQIRSWDQAERWKKGLVTNRETCEKELRKLERKIKRRERWNAFFESIGLLGVFGLFLVFLPVFILIAMFEDLLGDKMTEADRKRMEWRIK